MRGTRPIGEISRLTKPVKTLCLHADLLIDADRGWPLAEPLVGTFDDLGTDAFVIEEDAGFP